MFFKTFFDVINVFSYPNFQSSSGPPHVLLLARTFQHINSVGWCDLCLEHPDLEDLKILVPLPCYDLQHTSLPYS